MREITASGLFDNQLRQQSDTFSRDKLSQKVEIYYYGQLIVKYYQGKWICYLKRGGGGGGKKGYNLKFLKEIHVDQNICRSWVCCMLSGGIVQTS